MGISFATPEMVEQSKQLRKLLDKEEYGEDYDRRQRMEVEAWKAQDYAELKATVQDLKEKIDAMYHWYRYEYRP